VGNSKPKGLFWEVDTKIRHELLWFYFCGYIILTRSERITSMDKLYTKASHRYVTLRYAIRPAINPENRLWEWHPDLSSHCLEVPHHHGGWHHGLIYKGTNLWSCNSRAATICERNRVNIHADKYYWQARIVQSDYILACIKYLVDLQAKCMEELYLLSSFPVSSFPARTHQFPGVDFLTGSGRPITVTKCNFCRRPWLYFPNPNKLLRRGGLR